VGNRQLNAALHRIKSKREALRVLKRRLVRVVFNPLHADLHQAQLG
jgi:hypothetical protein